ncbi:hypothetical protein AVEN_156804-1 [Araneus ventricosus]|uniref:Uncharacterized protein n=1 Tax=Araneus ventricosus TaxID=182803 RepID=A0A4Y2SBN1_ARAVE|nr:hypothetical protein AVEN_156804-1 [Araneus ventricosus]
MSFWNNMQCLFQRHVAEFLFMDDNVRPTHRANIVGRMPSIGGYHRMDLASIPHRTLNYRACGICFGSSRRIAARQPSPPPVQARTSRALLMSGVIFPRSD